MKKNVAIPALLFGAIAAGGLLYLTHTMAFKVAAADPPPLRYPSWPAWSRSMTCRSFRTASAP